jgi:hypothetical protein
MPRELLLIHEFHKIGPHLLIGQISRKCGLQTAPHPLDGLGVNVTVIGVYEIFGVIYTPMFITYRKVINTPIGRPHIGIYSSPRDNSIEEIRNT